MKWVLLMNRKIQVSSMLALKSLQSLLCLDFFWSFCGCTCFWDSLLCYCSVLLRQVSLMWKCISLLHVFLSWSLEDRKRAKTEKACPKIGQRPSLSCIWVYVWLCVCIEPNIMCRSAGLCPSDFFFLSPFPALCVQHACATCSLSPSHGPLHPSNQSALTLFKKPQHFTFST